MTNNRTETQEFKQEFLRMASYIDCLLECSDTQKETLINFIARLSEYMPWYEDDDFDVEHTPERTETHECDYGKKETHGDVIFKSKGQFYSGRIANDEHKAVGILDQFTKAFCIDAPVTDDLVFRCSECPFEMPDYTCLMKKFKNKFAPDYKDFGSMGDP